MIIRRPPTSQFVPPGPAPSTPEGPLTLVTVRDVDICFAADHILSLTLGPDDLLDVDGQGTRLDIHLVANNERIHFDLTRALWWSMRERQDAVPVSLDPAAVEPV